MSSFPPSFSKHRKGILLAGFLFAALLAGGVANIIYNSPTPESTGAQESMSMTAGLTIKIDNKTTYYNPHDLIMYTFYDWNYCKIFNDTTACAKAATTWYSGVSFSTNGCPTYSTGGVVATPPTLTGSSRCSALGAVLSNTDGTTPINTVPLITGVLTTGGLAPVECTTSHVATTNIITLTATWTSSTTTSNIEKAGITLWNDKTNAVVINTFGTSGQYAVLTSDLFTPQTVTSGQSLQVIWTISM